MRTIFGLLPMLFVVGCGTSSAGTGTDMQPAANPLVGTWVSQGMDLAPILTTTAPYFQSISATFLADMTYTVNGVDKMMVTHTLTGTYATSASGVGAIWNVQTNQAMPSASQGQGIYSVDATKSPVRLEYEVVQTQPSLNGVSPPTAQGGFGSTMVSGKPFGAQNIQYYSKQ